MIICIECTTKTKDELDSLLRIGGYRDYNEAVALAVANQVLLHQGAKSTGRAADMRVADGPEKTLAHTSGGAETIESTILKDPREQVKFAETPQVFRILPREIRPGDATAMPNDAFTKGQKITIDRWIFGQHNKLLPLKASVRALANMSLEQRAGVPLSHATTEIAMACESLGVYLRRLDYQHGLMREESLATAFPNAATDINKSRLRFSNQFVATMNKHGQLRGFPIDLKLVNYKNPKEPKLLLTDAGWAFASFENPILDQTGHTNKSIEKLSIEERTFLIKHIRDNVPVEDCAFRAVLAAIDAGARNPDDLDSALNEFIPERSNEPFSAAFLSTQRAGVISRMTDLGLLLRERDGLRVTYATTKVGKDYLQLVAAA